MKLQTRLTILFVCISLIPLILVTAISFSSQRDELIRKTVEQLEVVADVQEKRLNEVLNHHLNTLKLVTASLAFNRQASYFDSGEDGAEELNRVLSDVKNAIPEVKQLSLFDTEGNLLISTNSVNGDSSSLSTTYERGQSRFVMTDIFKDANGQARVQLIGPVNIEGKHVATVTMLVSADEFISVTNDASGLGETGEIFLVKKNKSGDALFLTPLRYDAGAALTRGVSKAQIERPSVQALEGEDKVLLGKNNIGYNGGSVVAVTRYIDSLNWGMVVQMDRSEALASVDALRQSYSAIITMSVLVTILIVVMTTFAFVKPIRKMTLFAQNIQAGNFSMRTEVSSKDEIGLLAQTFNDMSAKLQMLYKNLEQEVAERTKDLKKFQMAVESSTQHIVITDEKGIVIYANPAVEQITGFGRNEVIGKKAGSRETWGGLMDKSFYKEMYKTLLEDKVSFTGEIKNRRKNGEEYITLANISPILDDNGEVEFFVGLERDITEEKRIDQAKSEFVSLASHQLRTPLSTVNWYAEMLMDGDAGKLNKEQKQYLGEIYTGNKRMVALVNALLNVSRLELGTFLVEPVETDLVAEVESIVKELESLVETRKIKLDVSLPKKALSIMVDPKLFRMSVHNLLTNAVKYTPEGGDVSISMKVIKDDVVIKVKDTGWGIPSNEQNKIFSKLFRATNVREKDTEGTGLGLYIVKSVAEHSGGDISFVSKEGKGTTFTYRFPKKGMAKKEGSRQLD